MPAVLLHDKTSSAIDSAISNGSHALLLTGLTGSGKQTIATHIADRLLGNAQKSPYYLSITNDDKALGIEKIRELQKFMQLKTTGSDTIRRVVILHDADTMTVEAQNALLKILEEPPEDTVLLLTASQPKALRPTIHSRIQAITILAPLKDQIIGHFLNLGYNGTDIERAHTLSNGQVGLMTALLDSETQSPLADQITVAKQLYGMTAFERLAKVDELSKSKESIPGLLFACKRICMTALEQAALKNQDKAVQTWHKQLSLIVDTESSLKYNPNSKLLLTNLFISM